VKKLTSMLILGLSLMPTLLFAGVVMEMVGADTAGRETERTRMYVQSGKLRIAGDSRASHSNVSMVFLGTDFLILDHDAKTYVVVDEAMLDELTSRISDAMTQMEAQLASLPPEQRAMAESMMKGKMQGLMGQQGEAPVEPVIERIGAGEWQSKPCTRYSVHQGGQKTQEICAAPLNDVPGSEDIKQTFLGMAEFVRKMTESIPIRLDSGISQNPGDVMDQIDGFPVHSLQYESGSASGEIWLESISEQDLDDALFSVPEGYAKQDPFG